MIRSITLAIVTVVLTFSTLASAKEAHLERFAPAMGRYEQIESVTLFYESTVGEKFTQANTVVMGAWTERQMLDVNTKMAAHYRGILNN